MVAGRTQHISRQDISLVLENHTTSRKPRIEKLVKWGQNAGMVNMSGNRIVEGLIEFVLKASTTNRIAKSVKWIYDSETLVKKPSQVGS